MESSRSKKKKALSSSKRTQILQRSSKDSDSHSPLHSPSNSGSISQDSPPPHSSKRTEQSRSSHGQRRPRDSEDSDSSDNGRYRKKKQSSLKRVTKKEIAEYLTKKAQKNALKVAKKLKSQMVSGYSNGSNPFGDANLNENFVWRKKIECLVTQGAPLDSFSMKLEKKRQREKMAEIKKVKKRRGERTIEKAQREVEIALLARERARTDFQDWEKKEKEFDFHQSKVRSEIQLREGRIRPIDILSKHLEPSDDFDIEINDPCLVLKDLTVQEMGQLHDDLKMHLDLESKEITHIQYWEALLVVCGWELTEARKKYALDQARVCGEQPPVELLAEERGLLSSIEVDIYKAKTFLKEIHAKMRKHLERLEQPLDGDSNLERDITPKHDDTDHDEKDAQALSPEPIMYEEIMEAEEAGSYSPELLHGEKSEEAIDPEEDRAILEQKRLNVLEEQHKRIEEAMASTPTPTKDNWEIKETKVMGPIEEGDALFGLSDEVNLDSHVSWWHEKHRPRKPKYFNRVHTRYVWNKYNQTHYDHDNPPPKTVQGYKFNIFYPDLVDKTKAPVYTIEKDGDSTATCIIRFHAGPPYEDITFRIVNKEWEHSHKKGFKCTFERGILHVYFNFKCYRYRR